jgi:hypothetical protein
VANSPLVEASIPYPELLSYAQSLSAFTSAPPNMPDLSLPGQPPPPLFFPPFPNEEKMRKGHLNAEAPLGLLGETHTVGRRMWNAYSFLLLFLIISRSTHCFSSCRNESAHSWGKSVPTRPSGTPPSASVLRPRPRFEPRFIIQHFFNEEIKTTSDNPET